MMTATEMGIGVLAEAGEVETGTTTTSRIVT
jgi:hypothetical protein